MLFYVQFFFYFDAISQDILPQKNAAEIAPPALYLPHQPLVTANAPPVLCPLCSTVYTYFIVTGGKSGSLSAPCKLTTNRTLLARCAH